MTEKFNNVTNQKIDHTKFGGYICLSDFNTNHRGKSNTHGSSIMDRIIQDQKFDQQCRKNLEFRKKYTEGKNNEGKI